MRANRIDPNQYNKKTNQKRKPSNDNDRQQQDEASIEDQTHTGRRVSGREWGNLGISRMARKGLRAVLSEEKKSKHGRTGVNERPRK